MLKVLTVYIQHAILYIRVKTIFRSWNYEVNRKSIKSRQG